MSNSRLSDIICLENGLSVIEKKPYKERVKRTEFPKRDSFRKKSALRLMSA